MITGSEVEVIFFFHSQCSFAFKRKQIRQIAVCKKKKKISSTCTNPVRLISLPLTVVLELKLSSVLAAFRRLNQNMSQVQKRLVTITYFTLSTYNLPQQIKQPTESLPQSVTVRSALNELG